MKAGNPADLFSNLIKDIDLTDTNESFYAGKHRRVHFYVYHSCPSIYKSARNSRLIKPI